MSDTPIQRKPPPALDRGPTAHQRRARIIAQLQRQAIAAAGDLSAQATRRGSARHAGRGKAEAWLCAGVFLLALGCILVVGCIVAASVSWQ